MPGALRERVRLAAGTAVLVAVATLAAGCGSGDPAARPSHSPDAATSQCRAKWAELADDIEGNEKDTEPSALAERWNTVVATVDYYASSARSSDCEDRLATQRKAITALEDFEKSLQPWDMEHQLAAVQSRAQDYSAPTGSKGKKGKSESGKKHGKDAPPSTAAVKKALGILRKQAPTASDDQRPAWQETHVVDLANKAAVKRARKDLDFLSHQSKAWRACEDAVKVIRKALRS